MRFEVERENFATPDGEGRYLYRRAEQELEQAQRATHPTAVKAHYVLACYYLDQV